MDFDYSGRDLALIDTINGIFDAANAGRPDLIRDPYDDQIKRNMAELGRRGILAMCMPRDVGGEDLPALSGIVAIEQIARRCPRTGTAALMAIGGPGLFIGKWGTPQQRTRYLPPLMRGETAFAISLTEPQAGTALTDLAATATRIGDKVVLNGAKTVCSGADLADHILLFCRFGPGVGNIGAVILDRDTPGMTISPAHHHMCGATWFDLDLDQAETPAENILFAGDAFRYLMASYSLERAAGGAWVLGVAQAAFDLAKGYALEREQFGRPICDFQLVQGRLADMYLAIEQARFLLYRSTASAHGSAMQLESSAAKIATTEAACFVTDAAMQMFGAKGMSQDLPLEWFYRLVRPFTVAGGTSDIHRSMIAGALLGRRFDHRK